jgi:hypothetical protein
MTGGVTGSININMTESTVLIQYSINLTGSISISSGYSTERMTGSMTGGVELYCTVHTSVTFIQGGPPDDAGSEEAN